MISEFQEVIEVKILIKGNEKQTNKTYDKIFSIFDKYSTLFKVETEKEYNTKNGYVLEIKSIPSEAETEINKISNIEILQNAYIKTRNSTYRLEEKIIMAMPKTHIEFIEKANRFGVREELVKFVEYLETKELITIDNMTLHGILTQAATDFLNEEIIYEEKQRG